MACTRCKGTGFFRQSAGVLHYGVPGLCWGCNGAGTYEAQIAIKTKIEADKIIGLEKLIEDLKIQAIALYDAHELGYISERKRNRRIESIKLELRSAKISDEQFKAHKVDEVNLKIAVEAYNKSRLSFS